MITGVAKKVSGNLNRRQRKFLDMQAPMPPRATPASIGAVAVAGLLTTVKDHGAKGDGVTMTGPAVASAILSVPAPGGVLYFPAGTYIVSVAAHPEDASYLCG